MWVYQEPEIQPIEKGPITPPPSLPPVPEQEPLPAIVQSTPETTVPHIPETEVLSRTAPASHRERSAPHQGCVLLAGSYLSGAFTAGCCWWGYPPSGLCPSIFLPCCMALEQGY